VSCAIADTARFTPRLRPAVPLIASICALYVPFCVFLSTQLGGGVVARVPCQPPASGYGTFMPVTYPGKRGYLLFLDDLTAAAGDP